ncbi:zinc carboxypeptidase [Paramyrothecium foliicola]|nr:zinc carboxypeptidase [Paramyrothecium foliicola]
MRPNSVLYGALAAHLVDACLLPNEGGRSLPKVRRNPQSGGSSDPEHIDLGIGTGDRFSNGRVAPRGLGLGARNNTVDTILNVGEVHTALKGLANAFDDVEIFTAPHPTFENRSVHGVVIGEPRVFIQSGIHARERGGPDNVIYFVADLLHARAAGSGLRYGSRSYSNDDVVRALSAGLVVVPLINPDGVAYDQRTDTCWRKNRNTTSAYDGDLMTIGVDLNRNYDFLWDYTKAFSLEADLSAASSDDPWSEVFHGLSPFSEAETRNSAWVMRKHPQLSWYLDLHSYTGTVLYGYGDDNLQTDHPAQSFTNSSYDGERGLLGEDDPNDIYGEYIRQVDLDAQLRLTGLMTEAMNDAGRVSYDARPSVSLYPTAGGSTDYAMSGFYGRTCGANRINGLTIEFGVASNSFNCPFYPNEAEYRRNMEQVAAGFMELLLGAVGELGEVAKYECDEFNGRPGNGTSNDGPNGGNNGGSDGNNGDNGGDGSGGNGEENGDNNEPPESAGRVSLPGLSAVLVSVSVSTLALAIFELL